MIITTKITKYSLLNVSKVKTAFLLHNTIMMGHDLGIRIESQSALPCHTSFRLSHVLFPEEELPVEIADIYGVQVNLERDIKYEMKFIILSSNRKECQRSDEELPVEITDKRPKESTGMC